MAIKNIKKEDLKKHLRTRTPKTIVVGTKSKALLFPVTLASLFEKVVNTRVIDIKELPINIAGAEEIKTPDNEKYSSLLYSALDEIIDKNSYFSGYKEKPKLVEHLGSVIKEIMASGVELGKLKENNNKKKWNDIIKLVRKLKELYKKEGFITPDEIYKNALEKAAKKSDTLYIYEENIFTATERKLLKRLSENNEVYKFCNETTAPHSGIAAGFKEGRLSPDFVELSAYPHPAEEIKGVLEKLLQEGHAGGAAIGLADYIGEISRVKYEAKQLNIEITPGGGLPLISFKSVRLFLSFLRLLENESRCRPLREILSSSALKKDKDISVSKCGKIISDHKKNRPMNDFSKFLEKEIKKKKNSNNKELKYLKKLAETAADIFQTAQEDIEKGIYSARPYLAIIENCIEGRDEEENQAIDALEGLLLKLEKNSYFLNNPVALTEKLAGRIKVKMTSRAMPDGNSVYVSDIKGINGGNFKRVVYAGLNHRNFSAQIPADPIFLYPERDAFNETHSEKIFTDSDIYTEKTRKDFIDMFAAVSKKLTFSWSANDKVTGQQLMPSSSLFEIYRALKGEPGDINKLEEYGGLQRRLPGRAGTIEGYIKSSGSGSPRSLEVFPNLKNYRKVLDDRKSRDITDFAGKVSIDGLKEKLTERAYSPSQFSSIIRCPLSFFYEKLLYLSEEDFSEIESFAWLDHMQWGSLIHEILCEFYRKVRGENIEPKEKILLQTGAEVLEKYVLDFPPPNKHLLKSAKNRVNNTLRHYFSHDIKIEDDYEPAYFEVAAGVPHALNPDPELFAKAPAETSMGGSKVNIKGIIDRVDSNGGGGYLLIDYKTGKNKVDSKDAFMERTYLQHIIYPILFKKAYSDKLDIVSIKSLYYFCTYKGGFSIEKYEGEKLELETERYRVLLDSLLSMIREGSFPENNGSCKYCDYKNICPGKDIETPEGTTKEYRKTVEEA